MKWPDLKFPPLNLFNYPRTERMTLPIQKVLHYSEAKVKKNFNHNAQLAIMEKLDGWFVFIDYVEDKWDVLRSSSGREIPSLSELSKKLQRLPKPISPYRLIFEATIPGKLFHETNGILNRKYEQAENVVLNLHDIIPLERPDMNFLVRYENCKMYIDVLQQIIGNSASLIPILEISTQENVFLSHFNKITERQGEGIILKNMDSGYFFGKRNQTMMKIKEEVTKDLVVAGLVEGEGKYKGTLGALVVQGRNRVTHSVSGMTDGQRELWWENPSFIMGKVVEVKAMKELEDGTLREPRFKCIREDKTIMEID